MAFSAFVAAVASLYEEQKLPEEVLSDCAYRYHGATGEIEILTEKEGTQTAGKRRCA
jgi:hypothetical protein